MNALNKCISVLLALALHKLVGDSEIFVYGTMGVAFVHFGLATVYEKKYLGGFLSAQWSRFGVLSLGLLAIFDIQAINRALTGFHFSISDSSKGVFFQGSASITLFVGAWAAFDFSLVVLTYFRSILLTSGLAIALSASVATGLFFAFQAYRLRDQLGLERVVDAIGMLVATASLAIAQYTVLKLSDHLIFFVALLAHFLFWLLNPYFASRFRPRCSGRVQFFEKRSTLSNRSFGFCLGVL